MDPTPAANKPVTTSRIEICMDLLCYGSGLVHYNPIGCCVSPIGVAVEHAVVVYDFPITESITLQHGHAIEIMFEFVISKPEDTRTVSQ